VTGIGWPVRWLRTRYILARRDPAGAATFCVETRGVSPVAVTVLPVWAWILLALTAPPVAAVAVVVGKRQQDATLKEREPRGPWFESRIDHRKRRAD
jgi:hypothetical protein